MASREELAEMQRMLEASVGVGGAEDTLKPDLDWKPGWGSLSELELTAFCVPEDLGGFGCELSASVVTARVFGAALHAGPFPSITAATYGLLRGLPSGHREGLAEALIRGESTPTLARLDPASTIEPAADGQVVNGVARLVTGAAEADRILVLDARSTKMVQVEAGPEIVVAPSPSFDETRGFADLRFDAARATPVDTNEEANEEACARVERVFGLLLAADSLGGVERMLERTRRYALQREAFGRSIAGFQAVQHRLVDHTLKLRAMTLLVERAAEAFTREEPEAERLSLLAETAVSTGALPLLHDLLQLTGGIAFTWEHGLHYYERRAQLNARLAGNPRAAQRRLAAIEGWKAKPESSLHLEAR